jgi:hypothetical protein
VAVDTKESPNGLSIWFGEAPPASSHLTLVWPDATTTHLSLMDLAALKDPETGLTGAELLNVIGRFVAQFAGVPRGPRSD